MKYSFIQAPNIYRLVTGGRDGVLRIWNYNNGQCLRTLKKLSNEEVTCVIHVTVSKNK